VPIGNLSALESSGVDFSAAYPIPLPFASGPFGQSLNVRLLVTWLGKWELDDVDYAGTIGAYNYNGAFPKYKGNLNLGYRVGPVNLSYNLQYIDAMDNQGNIPAFQDGGYVGVTSTIYQDLSAQWAINDKLELNLGARNLANVKPKFFDIPIDQNTDPSTYDMLGRFYFGSLRAKF
jgi:outer membrane receptor protein involved in Fe transport